MYFLFLFLFLFILPPTGHGYPFTGGLLLLLRATATREPIPAPGGRRTQAGPTDQGTGGVGNRTRDLPLHGLTAYRPRQQGRISI